MKIGICAWAFDGGVQGRRAVSDMSAAAAEAGFHALEAAFSERAAWSPGPGAVPVTSIATLALHRFPLTTQGPRQEAGMGAVRSMMKMARDLGAGSISFSPGGVSSGTPQDALARSLDTLQILVGEAAELGIRVAVENVPGHILATRSASEFLLGQIAGLGLCLDIGNALVDPPLESWLDTFAERIIKVHLSDGHIQNARLVPARLGAGQVQWSSVNRWLDERGSPVDLYLETAPRVGPQTHTEAYTLAHARRSVDEVLTCN
jgi:sugar phosphate isomerase/epimerase